MHEKLCLTNKQTQRKDKKQLSSTYLRRSYSESHGYDHGGCGHYGQSGSSSGGRGHGCHGSHGRCHDSRENSRRRGRGHGESGARIPALPPEGRGSHTRHTPTSTSKRLEFLKGGSDR